MKGASILALGATAAGLVGGAVVPRNEETASSPLLGRSASGTPLSIPFQRFSKRNHKDPEQTKKFAASQHDYVRAKWGNNKVKREAKEKLAKRQILGLSDIGADSFYVGQLGIGTPNQDFNIILDTGSADFWLADSSCTSSGCSGVDLFSASSSSSYRASNTPFQIQYGSGAAQGTLATDTVSLAGYTVNSQTFAVVDQLAAGTLDPPASGIMGLGFQTLASSGATPFWQVLAEGSTFQDKVFTFQLVRDETATSAETAVPGGIFTLGKLDSAQYTGSINTVPLDGNEGYWTIAMQGYSVNGATTTLSSNNVAAIDTGTSLIIAPSDVAAAIYQQIPNSQPYGSGQASGTYAIPCSSDVQITLSFGGQTYSVNSQDMLNGALDNSGQYCLGGVLGEDLGQGAPAYIVGDTFLKNVFTVFQYSPAAVGFASLVGSTAQTAATAVNAAAATPTSSAATSSSNVLVTSTSAGGVIPTFATTSVNTAATSANTPVAGSGLSAPVAVTTIASTAASITPAGQSTSGSNSAPSHKSSSLPVYALCSALAIGFFAVL
jgi:cathepsin D